MEGDQRSNESELYKNLKTNHNLTKSDINTIDVKSQLEHQNQNQETKQSGWMFDKINSMKISFHKTGELNGSSCIKHPLRSSAILNIEKNDKNCFIWSILASLHPCENDHRNRVSNNSQYFNELNIDAFDFTIGFKCCDMLRFEKSNVLSIILYGKNFLPRW